MDNSVWFKHIESLRTKTKDNVSKKHIYNAVEKNVIDSMPSEPFGVLLSGGVDSTLIAKICKDNGADFRCFCVGIKGSADINGAKLAAEKLKLNLVSKVFSSVLGLSIFTFSSVLFRGFIGFS